MPWHYFPSRIHEGLRGPQNAHGNGLSIPLAQANLPLFEGREFSVTYHSTREIGREMSGGPSAVQRRPPFRPRFVRRHHPIEFGEAAGDVWCNLEEGRLERMNGQDFRANIARGLDLFHRGMLPEPEYYRAVVIPRNSQGRILLIEDVSIEEYLGKTCIICREQAPEDIEELIDYTLNPHNVQFGPMKISTTCCGENYMCSAYCSLMWYRGQTDCYTCDMMLTTIRSYRIAEDMMAREIEEERRYYEDIEGMTYIQWRRHHEERRHNEDEDCDDSDSEMPGLEGETDFEDEGYCTGSDEETLVGEEEAANPNDVREDSASHSSFQLHMGNPAVSAAIEVMRERMGELSVVLQPEV